MLVVTGFLFTLAFAHAWMADVSTVTGRLDLLASVATRHPLLVPHLARYDQDAVTLLGDAEPILRGLDAEERARALEVGPALTISLAGAVNRAGRTYDAAAVEKWRAALLARGEAMRARRMTLTTFGADLRRFRFSSVKERVDLLALSPFVYDRNGRAQYEIDTALAFVARASAEEFDACVYDTWAAHLEPMLDAATGEAAWRSALDSFRNSISNASSRRPSDGPTPPNGATKFFD